MLPHLWERHPDESIELLLLRAMFAGTQVDEMKKTVAAGGNSDEVPRPLLDLVKALYQISETGTQTLKVGDLRISLEKGEGENAA
jgi:oxaloacetate decarboxylase alpha subunit